MDFNGEPKKQEVSNALKNEHLNKGILPIMGAIYDRSKLDTDSSEFINNFEKNADNLDFRLNKEKFLSNKSGKNKEGTYLMSKIDNQNKISKGYFDCTGVCFSGVDKNTGENISFISHQNPESILENTAIMQRFKDDLNKKIDDFISRSKPGTVDAVVVGGNKDINYSDTLNSVDIDNMNPQQIQDYMDKQYGGPFEKYCKSIFFVSKIIFNKLKYYPVVISGPNSNVKENDPSHDNALDLYFDTKNKRVYQVRPENESVNNESYSGEDVNVIAEKYK